MILEACVGNLNDALSAQSKGAQQLELCDRLDLDGNSPPIQMVKAVTEALDIPTKVIINPKPFDYQYSQEELQSIADYIKSISIYNVEGLVFGPVDKDGFPDLDAIDFISNVSDLPLTYHKAIDSCTDILSATQMLVDHDTISYILTSGGKKTANEGRSKIQEMKLLIEKSESSIKLIGAGRITNDNIYSLHQQLNLDLYHGKLIVGAL